MRSIARFVALALCAPTVAASRVWVVEPAGGGVQAAIDAASDGDLLIVKSGQYAGFRIKNRSLCVIADAGASVTITGPVLVRDVDAMRDVVLAGLALDRQLWCTDSQGSIRVESCRLLGDPTAVGSGRHAALVERCREVVIVESTLQGASQLGLFTAGSGLSMSASNVALFGVTATGGAGWPGAQGFDGMPGADGARAFAGSSLYATGSELLGGAGGAGPAGGCHGSPCDGGNGGRGLSLAGAGTCALRLDTSVRGGAGGAPGFGTGLCSSCPGAPGASGTDVATSDGATIGVIQGQSRTIDVQFIAREASPILLEVAGASGDRAGVLVALQTGFRFHAVAHGVATSAGPRIVWVPAPLDAGGRGSLVVRTPRLTGADEGSTLFLQSIFRDGHGEVWLGTPRAVAVVDSAL